MDRRHVASIFNLFNFVNFSSLRILNVNQMNKKMQIILFVNYLYLNGYNNLPSIFKCLFLNIQIEILISNV